MELKKPVCFFYLGISHVQSNLDLVSGSPQLDLALTENRSWINKGNNECLTPLEDFHQDLEGLCYHHLEDWNQVLLEPGPFQCQCHSLLSKENLGNQCALSKSTAPKRNVSVPECCSSKSFGGIYHHKLASAEDCAGAESEIKCSDVVSVLVKSHTSPDTDEMIVKEMTKLLTSICSDMPGGCPASEYACLPTPPFSSSESETDTSDEKWFLDIALDTVEKKYSLNTLCNEKVEKVTGICQKEVAHGNEMGRRDHTRNKVFHSCGKKRGRKKVYQDGNTEEESTQFKRERNNQACKKFRFGRKQREIELFERELNLERQNDELRGKIERMKAEIALLHHIMTLGNSSKLG